MALEVYKTKGQMPCHQINNKIIGDGAETIGNSGMTPS